MRSTLLWIFAGLGLVAMLVLAAGNANRSLATSAAVPVPEINIDVEDDQRPANTATSVGSLETCARIDNNDSLDQDEDAADVIEVDVVADGGGIPGFSDNGTPGNPADDFGGLFGFGIDFNFDSARLRVNTVNQSMLSNANTGSNPFIANSGGPFPNTTGMSNPAQIETGLPLSKTAEVGEGVLVRFEVEGTSAGLAALSLSNIGILDAANTVYRITSINSTPGAVATFIAVDQACPQHTQPPDSHQEGAPTPSGSDPQQEGTPTPSDTDSQPSPTLPGTGGPGAPTPSASDPQQEGTPDIGTPSVVATATAVGPSLATTNTDPPSDDGFPAVWVIVIVVVTLVAAGGGASYLAYRHRKPTG